MVDEERRARGEEKIKEVYAGDVIVPPEGASEFADIISAWQRDSKSTFRFNVDPRYRGATRPSNRLFVCKRFPCGL